MKDKVGFVNFASALCEAIGVNPNQAFELTYHKDMRGFDTITVKLFMYHEDQLTEVVRKYNLNPTLIEESR